MKESTTSKLKLGAFVAAGILVLLFFLFFIGKNKNLFSSTITLNGMFGDVSGLTEGNNVRLAGIKVGTVTSVEIISDSLVKVSLIVEKEAQKFIKSDAQLSIGSDGLMGDKVINIVKGSPDTTIVKDGSMLTTIKPMDTGKLLASLSRTAYNAEKITSNIAEISVKMNSKKGIIGRILNDDRFADNIEGVVNNLKSASGGLSENMEAAKHSFLLRGYYKKKAKKDGNQDSTSEKKDRKILNIFKKHKEKTDTVN